MEPGKPRSKEAGIGASDRPQKSPGLSLEDLLIVESVTSERNAKWANSLHHNLNQTQTSTCQRIFNCWAEHLRRGNRIVVNPICLTYSREVETMQVNANV